MVIGKQDSIRLCNNASSKVMTITNMCNFQLTSSTNTIWLSPVSDPLSIFGLPSQCNLLEEVLRNWSGILSQPPRLQVQAFWKGINYIPSSRWQLNWGGNINNRWLLGGNSASPKLDVRSWLPLPTVVRRHTVDYTWDIDAIPTN